MTNQARARTAQRRSRDREARIDRIRRAAAGVFAERGFEQATMDQVAERAELAKATLYYYFANKQELFADIVEHATESVGHLASENLSPGSDASQAAQAICRFTLAYFRREPEIAALLLPLMGGNPSRTEAMLGPQAARKVSAAHAPLFKMLGPVDARLGGRGALGHLLVTLMLGFNAKLHHGGGDHLEAELALFARLLEAACAKGPR